MKILVGVGFILVGLLLVAFSRTIADKLFVAAPKGRPQSGLLVYMGLGDSYPARLYRWLSSFAAGLALVAVGIAVLADAVQLPQFK